MSRVTQAQVLHDEPQVLVEQHDVQVVLDELDVPSGSGSDVQVLNVHFDEGELQALDGEQRLQVEVDGDEEQVQQQPRVQHHGREGRRADRPLAKIAVFGTWSLLNEASRKLAFVLNRQSQGRHDEVYDRDLPNDYVSL